MNNKKIAIIVLALVILVLLGLGVRHVMQVSKPIVLIEKADTKLSPSNLLFVQKRLADEQKQVSAFDEKTSLITKVSLYFALAADQRALGEYGEAKRTLETAMAIDPKNSNIIQTYSSLLSVMGDKNGALVYIDKAIALFPTEDNYWRWKIELEKDMGKTPAELEMVFKDGLKKTDNDLNVVTYYAVFLEGEKRYTDAIAQWKEAIKIEPSLKATYQAEIERLQKM